jgi:RNA polymerase sigma factor (sigma-70 family)
VEVVDKNRLMQGCAQGGRALDQAIGELHRHYWSALLREARRVLGTVEAASDAAQDALIKVWRDCKTFRGEAEVWAWLRPIVRRTAIDILRARHVEVPLVDEHNEVLAEVEATLRGACDAAADDPLAIAESAEGLRVFQACYARFAADHPESACALRWVAEDDLDYAEVAAQGRTPNATREFVSQSRKKARVYLAPWYALVRGRDAQPAAALPGGEPRALRAQATARRDDGRTEPPAGLLDVEGAR